ncbi:TetR/AcrR family transcriptional regulator [Melghirimyces algeriensis]|uniref:Transcriptional regulator, TetR family n=1 Tax=Melghirimyces algeriensis TaxID=910412 RepID=A0A521FBQ5_9BACL|nr:TetR/AcrR family transcriptional regulator [Melghirimyces algeriensis]SMO93617.1 transcriptional regulator, TetR family [Melghirimyces algeriensis]
MSQEKTEQIFQAAVEIFAQHGFERSKMDEIARHAGVAKGTIYYHFKSKEELFVALMNNRMEKIKEMLNRCMSDTDDPVKQLRNLLEMMVTYLVQNGTFAKLLISEAWGSVERQWEFRARIRELVDIIERVIHRGISQERFYPSNESDTSFSIFGAVSVLVLQEVFRDPQTQSISEERISQMVDSIEQMVYQGVVISGYQE